MYSVVCCLSFDVIGSVVCCSLFGFGCVLFCARFSCLFVRCSLCVVGGLFVACCLLFVFCCLSLVVCCSSLFVVRCSFVVVGCSLVVVC